MAAEKIFIADKQTLDNVKTDTTKIITDVENVKTVADAILAKPEPSIGTNSKYFRGNKSAAPNKDEIILDVIGKGLFHFLNVVPDASFNKSYEIWIDGVKIFANTNTTLNVTGLYSKDSLIPSGNVVYHPIYNQNTLTNSPIGNFELTDLPIVRNESKYYITSTPLPFNNNLKIILKNYHTGYMHHFQFSFGYSLK